MAGKIGVIGLGDMGRPMARRLIDQGIDPVVWTRSQETLQSFRDTGTRCADSPGALFAECDTVILMLANEKAVDAVMQRGTPAFADLVRGCTVIQMGTTPPAHSRALEAEILIAGGRYAEVPVSGSSLPAATGDLVAMQAGDPQTLADIAEVIAPLVATKVDCGPVPKALQMKLAVNNVLAGVMFGLIEGTNLAQRCDLDMQVFRRVLEAGQMSSPVLQMKLPKLIDEDFTPQASVYQTYLSMTMMLQAGQEVGAAQPVATAAHAVQGRTIEMGLADRDMIAALLSFRDLNREA